MAKPKTRSSPPPMSAPAGSRLAQLELRSKTADEALLADATDRYLRLSRGRQLRLAVQAADCHRMEYTRRIHSLVGVEAGFKRRRVGRRVEVLTGTACVVFMVRAKKTEKSIRDAAQHIPKFLLLPALVEGDQVICAVPTDVQLATRIVETRPDSGAAVYSRPTPPAAAEFGAIACIVEDGIGDRYVIAPIHVLSPTPQPDGSGIAGEPATVYRVASKKRPPDSSAMLEATMFGGSLAPEPADSFDVQFASVLDWSRVQAAFAGIALSTSQPYAKDIVALGDLMADGRRAEIMVPANHPQRMRQDQPPLLATVSLVPREAEMPYEFRGGSRRVRQRLIELQLDPGEVTIPGDSGSPVCVPHDDGGYVFIGMHVGGNRLERTSLIVPAWDLLDPARYLEAGGAIPGEILRLVDPATLTAVELLS